MRSEYMSGDLFAKIHLDNEIRGSTLEGGHAIESADYLLKMTEGYVRDVEKTDNLDSLINSLKKIIEYDDWHEDIEYLVDLHDMACKLIKNEKNTLNVIKSIEKRYFDSEVYLTLEDTIKEMNEGESITVSGGLAATSTESGHAMLYQFVKIGEKFELRVFNTGDGVNRHSENHGSLWDQTQAVYSIRDSDDIGNILKILAAPLVLRTLMDSPVHESNKLREINFELQQKYTVDYIYDELSKFGDLNNLEKSEDTIRVHIGQESGTCSHRVFTPLMCSEVTDENTRQSFRLYYKLASIFKFYEECQNQPFRIDDWKLLLSATTRLMRIIIKKIPADNVTAKNLAQAHLERLEMIRSTAAQVISNYKSSKVDINNEYQALLSSNSEPAKAIKYEPSELMEEKQFSAEVEVAKKVTKADFILLIDLFQENKTLSWDNLQLIMWQLNNENDGNIEKRIIIEQLFKIILDKNISITVTEINDISSLNRFYGLVHEELSSYIRLSETNSLGSITSF